MPKINRTWPWDPSSEGKGAFPEEIKNAQRREKNPLAAPMPSNKPSKFLDPKRSSDALRAGLPKEALYTGQPETVVTQSHHISLTKVLFRRRRRFWADFEHAVESEELPDLPEGRQAQMKAMIRREHQMLNCLQKYHALADQVYGALIGQTKG